MSRAIPSISPGTRARLVAEFLGTAFLLAAVVGSGIMAQTLSDDVGLASPLTSCDGIRGVSDRI